jgi:hypothetical protein
VIIKGKILEKTRRHFTLHFNGYSMYPFLKPGDRLIARRVSPKSLEIGDIVLVPDLKKKYVAHRLVKMLPPDKCILKGDYLPEPDLEPAELSTLSGKVVAILRKDRLIPLSTGPRSSLKKVYAFLSLNGLTSGAIRLKAKNILLRPFPLDKSKGHHNEWRFIIETLSNRSHQTDSNLDWIRIKTVASEEGVIGILYKTLKDAGMPQSALASFRDYYLSITALNIININALEKLEDALSSKQIEVMTLKGASLLNSTYADIGMRPMGDLDLMVRPEEREGFVNLLYNLGYKEVPLFPHLFNKDRVVIDLHLHALNTDRIAGRAGLFPVGMGPVWANSVPWREGHQWLRRPDDADNILLLSQHYMKHSFSKLIWLVDILKLITNNDVMFQTDLFKRADYLQQGKSLSYTLYLLNKVFYHKPAMELGLKDISLGLSRLERGILEARANGQSIDLIGPVMAIFCVQGFSNKVALGWESLFPKNEMVKQEATYTSRFWTIFPSLLRRFRLIFGYIIRG